MKRIIIALSIVLLLFSVSGCKVEKTESVAEVPVVKEETIKPLESATKTPAESTPAPTEEKEKEPLPETVAEPESVEITPAETDENFCTLSVVCTQILENKDKLKAEKVHLIPADGVIYANKKVLFSEGESVFDILLRELRQNNIHIEFEKVPMYNSAYIEGIANLYEFDCGAYSGWMYSVNGETPKIGSSQYVVKKGDAIELFYSCNTLP